MNSQLTVSDIAKVAKANTVPFSVLVEVCYRCNEHCVHCCVNEHTAEGLSLEQYDTLFDQMVDAGTLFVILTGGEPFLRPDFVKIVRSARQRRISVTIFTNGTLITPAHADELQKLFVQQVHISVYSANPDKHDAITRIRGSHSKSLAAIQELKNRGISVRIKCPLMRSTFDGISDLKILASNLGIPVQFGTIITARNNGDSSTHALRLSEVQIASALRDAEIDSASCTPVHDLDDEDCIPCDTIFNGGAIDPTGNVYPCNQWREIGGNILHAPFGKIWNESPVFKRLRGIRLRHLAACRDCKIFSHCARCPGLAALEDGDLQGCSSSAKMLAGVRCTLGTYPSAAHNFSPSLERSQDQ